MDGRMEEWKDGMMEYWGEDKMKNEKIFPLFVA